jgi:hypothetical protein
MYDNDGLFQAFIILNSSKCPRAKFVYYTGV